MPFYGRQTQGGSWVDCEIDVFGRLITLTGGESIVAAYAYLQTTAGVSTANVKAALYRLSDDSLAYESNQLAVAEDTTGGWKTISWPVTTPAAGQYFLCIAAGPIAGGANTINIAYDLVSASTDYRGETNLLAGAQSTYPTLPNPIVWGGADGTYDLSIYLETSGGGGSVSTRTLDDAVSVADLVASSALRNRLLSSALLVVDGPLQQYTTTNAMLDSYVQVSDEALATLIRRRLLSDDLQISDSAIASLLTGNILFRVLTDSLNVSDSVLSACNRNRVISDLLALTDETLTAAQRFIVLSDALTVNSEIISAFLTQNVAEPRIVIGFDQPQIELGGYGID